MKIIGEPGHWKSGADTNHFLGIGCHECDAHAVSRMNLGKVQDLYRTGAVGQDMFEAYMHVWATSADRMSGVGSGWTDQPSTTEAAELSGLLSSIVAERRSAGQF